MKYPIFERFSVDARRAAATATYRASADGAPRTTDDCCPLGVALNADGVCHPSAGGQWFSPVSMLVCGALTADPSEVGGFIDDWDDGKIDPADLPALLEVP